MPSNGKSRKTIVRARSLRPRTGPGDSFRRTAQMAQASATGAKNEFGSWLEKAIRGEVVVITKHGAPKAVLLSVDEYAALARAPEARIDRLSAEFDDLLERMQTPRARRGMRSAFHATEKQLGKEAVAAAAKRG